MKNNIQKSRSMIQNGRRRYVISIREPWQTPDDKVELPSPDVLPQAPSPINLLTTLLPPVLMMGGMVAVSLFTSAGIVALLPMAVMGLGFPMANLINQTVQQKKYKKALIQREEQYRAELDRQKTAIQAIADEQRKALEQESPGLTKLIKIALARGDNPRLWWRRTHDEDFLRLRLGTGSGAPSFTIVPPKFVDSNEPLKHLPHHLIREFEEITDLPLFIDLKTAGSTVISSKSQSALYGFSYRLILETIIHHSPDDVHLVLMADDIGSASKWEWLKWSTHTHALYSDISNSGVLLTSNDIDQYLEKLREIYLSRKEKEKIVSEVDERRTSYLIVVDDSGKFRQSSFISMVAHEGIKYGFYVIFMGEHDTPNTCRSRIVVTEAGDFRYTESWLGKGVGKNSTGETEFADLDDCEKVARALTALEISGKNSMYNLPASVRLSALLGSNPFAVTNIISIWQSERKLLFPAGLYIKRQNLETYMIDFRPDHRGGRGEYHAMLIGTTGSGKSIFLQSLVLATAHQHSPAEINFLFMDFKAGAAELKKISDLPHVVGMITDLNPTLADRALKALENELERRKNIFDQANNITDIWDFNARYPDKALPHLLVVIDEFAEGIKILPDLVERLKSLGRQGRAFGMYFLLANQEVNSAVEQLKPNVGWYIVLKVKRSEEMSLIDRTLPIAPGRGRGYIRMGGDIVEFQGAFSGNLVGTSKLDENEDFIISSVEPDGKLKLLYKNTPSGSSSSSRGPAITELEILVASLQQAAKEMNLKPARKIYQDPLPEQIPLSEVYEGFMLYRQFVGGNWSADENPSQYLRAPIGMIDIPEDCLQTPLVVDFTQNDGNLWVIGSPGSGKSRTATTLLMSLAYSHRPDEVNFYILEFGEGDLKVLENLPHTGAVIRANEPERIERLFKYINSEIESRSQSDNWRETGKADIFLVINNFVELWKSFPDQGEDILRFIGKGKSAGVHLIILTNRGGELQRTISSNISRRIVLQLATRDEYFDVIGKNPPLLSAKSLGRGYFVGERIAECQIALPIFEDHPENILVDVIRSMKTQWKGASPFPIRTLPNIIPFEAISNEVAARAMQTECIEAPVGYGYDTLQMIWANLLDDGPTWLILGPPRSGKTNMLISFGYGALRANPGIVEVKAFVLRRTRNSLDRLAETNCPIQIYRTSDEIVNECKRIRDGSGDPNKSYLILIDDLSAAASPGNEDVLQQLNSLTGKMSADTNIFIAAAGIREELQTSLMTSPLFKMLRQGRSGIAFSKDLSDLDWIGVALTPTIRKMPMIIGRGIFSNRGSASIIQVPYIDIKLAFGNRSPGE